jgi:hypothetical protein
MSSFLIPLIIYIDVHDLRNQLGVQEPNVVGLRDFFRMREGREELDTVVFDHKGGVERNRFHKFLKHNGFRIIATEACNYKLNLVVQVVIQALNYFREKKEVEFIFVTANWIFAYLFEDLQEKGIKVQVESLPLSLAEELKLSARKTECANLNGSETGGPTGQGHGEMAYLEEKYPGSMQCIGEVVEEAEKLFLPVKKLGLSKDDDNISTKRKEAAIKCFNDGEFKHIKPKDLEDEDLYVFSGRQAKRKFIETLLRKSFLREFRIKREKVKGQRLSGRFLYGIYKKVKRQK